MSGLPPGADEQLVASFFDAFNWDGSAPDAEVQSAEDFLSSLGD